MIILNSESCPLSATEQRLSDCLSLWLETEKNYFTPNSFRLSLNNCIQAMRNVTFVLQKSKSEFNNFDNWYSGWQKKMREDIIMAWVIKARNVIVKEGDLSTFSKLRISIVETWFAKPYIEVDALPFITTEEFARVLAQNLPNTDLPVKLLRAERRWVDEQLKEYELLETLVHVFVYLSDLLLDAHKNLSCKDDLLKCQWYTHYNSGKDHYPACMIAQEWERTIWLDVNTNEILHPVSYPVKRISDEEVQKHYGHKQRIVKSEKPKNLVEEADFLFEEAKNILIIDGHHLPIALIGYSDGHKDIIGLQMGDRAEKHLAIRQIAADIKITGAISVIIIGEVWVSDTNNYRLTPSGIESPTLREALQLIATNADGVTYSKLAFFRKDKQGKIKIGKEVQVDNKTINMLAPIKEVWNKNC